VNKSIPFASGGVGIAAIQLAKNIDAEIFATAGNEAKKEYLLNSFSLDTDHIINSRGPLFLGGNLAASQ
jgi:NADPH:quinone reductase-like Zn-dependent oxidoreductase